MNTNAKSEPYHDHLDVCAECREKVMFSTCAEGARLLKLQATGVDPGPTAPACPPDGLDDLITLVSMLTDVCRAPRKA